MSEQIISAGDEVDSYCTTCKLVLAHQVVALVDEKVEKVICKTCGKRHKYRPNPPKSRTKKSTTTRKKTASTTKKKTTRTRKTKDPEVKWEETLADKDLSNPKTYTMDAIFEENDIINHNKFGRGLVTEIRVDGKMEVLFKDGTKLLVFGRSIN